MTKKQQKIRIQKQAAYEKILVSSERITYSDCLLAVGYNGQIISSIPSALITKELCIAALKNNDSNENLIQYIPKNLLTKELAASIVAINGTYLKYLPIEAIDANIILAAVKQTICATKYIPEKYKTEETYQTLIDMTPNALKYIERQSLSLCKTALNKSPASIVYIKDISILTDEILEKTVLSDWKSLKYIPAKRKTKKLCDYAFNADCRAFKFFPNKYKTRELCEFVIDKDTSLIQYCPARMISFQMCEKSLKENGLLLNFVPAILKTESICLLAIKQNYEAFQFVPRHLLTNNFFIKCLKVNCDTFVYMPDELKTAKTYKMLLKCVSFSKPFEKWLTSNEEYYFSKGRDYRKYIALKKFSNVLPVTDIDSNILKLERKLHLRKTIESFYNSDANIFTTREKYFKRLVEKIFLNFKDFYTYLGEDLQDSNLIEYGFEGIDLSLYNLKGARLCSKLLIEQGNYDSDFYDSSIGQFNEEVSLLPVLEHEITETRIISHAEQYSGKLNSFDRKIFYITDIHLNHKLKNKFPRSATFDEINVFIQKYVEQMMRTASDKGYFDFLLIGGDVSFCFEISKIFYKELCKHWTPSKIIVILGNHELWDFNRSRTKALTFSFEDIVEKYRLLFSELGISFLQNSLLIAGQFSSTILSENDILDKNINELCSLTLNSDLIVFGGIGFSAYNTDFNATKGIYRNTIASIQDDLHYTQKTELVYNKLCDAFSQNKTIILSHMALKDWSQRGFIPNWVYIHGHTHSNYYVQSEECTVYADNQIGYMSKNVGLKYFKTSLRYDIFRYYSDGIYHITQFQYLEFNNGNGTPCTFNRDVDDIIMIKRQGIYLFLIENKENDKLFLLNGGAIAQLKITDLNYYYDNMLKYCDYIKTGLQEYNKALKSISNIVKQIGGSGKIHGCIVDIDFSNHIYLNPKDGSISAYYSPTVGNRYEFPTIEHLLNSQLPHLYAKYINLIGTSPSLNLPSNINVSLSEAMHVIDTTQYKPSLLMKRLQYITENNVIRFWMDDFIINNDQFNDAHKKLLT